MRKEEIIILGREDMFDEYKDMPLLSIHLNHLKVYALQIFGRPIALFIDDDGATKILKNRYGDRGEGLFRELIKQQKDKEYQYPTDSFLI